MESKKKRRGRHSYLEDFQKNAAGEYIYTGLLHHYQDRGLSRTRALAMLWVLAVGMAAAALCAGCVPAAGMQNTVYVLLPYVCGLISAATVIYGLCRLTAGGDPLRDYVYRATVTQFRLRIILVMVFSGAALVGDLVYLALHGVGDRLAGTLVFLLCQGIVFGAAFGWKVVFARLSWDA